MVSKISQKLYIWGSGLKHSQLTGYDEQITWLTFEQILSFFLSYGPLQGDDE